MRPTDRWKQLLDERLREAVTVLGRVPGVHGFIVGGRMGRGEPWPMSDIDLLPIYTDSADRAAELDLGWLAFTAAEIRDAMGAGPEQAAARMTDRRWFHGLDKAYGGHAATATRCSPPASPPLPAPTHPPPRIAPGSPRHGCGNAST